MYESVNRNFHSYSKFCFHRFRIMLISPIKKFLFWFYFFCVTEFHMCTITICNTPINAKENNHGTEPKSIWIQNKMYVKTHKHDKKAYTMVVEWHRKECNQKNLGQSTIYSMGNYWINITRSNNNNKLFIRTFFLKFGRKTSWNAKEREPTEETKRDVNNEW